MEAREHGNELAAAHTGDLRRNFLAYTTDLIPLRGGGGAQFSRQFGRFAVQASKGFVWEIYFHALHTATLATLMEDRKSNSGQYAGRAHSSNSLVELPLNCSQRIHALEKDPISDAGARTLKVILGDS